MLPPGPLVRGRLRGNAVIWDGAHWRLASTGEDAEAVVLPCVRCGVRMRPDEPDACLGEIPGATGACCGHGVHRGYVTWEGIPAGPGWWQRAYVGEEKSSSH